jgi:hypothetical protein
MLKSEKETIFRWDSAEKVVHVYSCHQRVWRRAERQGFTPVRRDLVRGRETARWYRIPLASFRYGFRDPNRPRRPAPTWLLKPKIRQKESGNDQGSAEQGGGTSPE